MIRMIVSLDKQIEVMIDCLSRDDFPFRIGERVYLKIHNQNIVNLLR